MAEAATKEECDYVSRLSGGAIVFGMGAPVTTMTEADRKALADAEAREFTSTMGELAGFVMGEASDGADKQERKKFKRLHDAFINRGEAA
jgi:hypothetical protein